MIQRLYIDNYKCFRNFDLQSKGLKSLLLLGRNGTGKSTIGEILYIFQSIGQGKNHLAELFDKQSLQMSSPVRLEIEVQIAEELYVYTLAIELPENFKEYRIREEKLLINHEIVFTRTKADITFLYQRKQDAAVFSIDWHLVALPVIRTGGNRDVVKQFTTWLGKMILLKPVPKLITGEWHTETDLPLATGENLGAWLSSLVLRQPRSYSLVFDFLKELMPDFSSLENDQQSTENFLEEKIERKVWKIHFQTKADRSLKISLGDLSDGEKCFLLCALLLATNELAGPVFCFWDEPDSYLSLDEVGQFILHLRRAFYKQGQFWASSHSPEAISQFSDENTFYLSRASHLEPVRVRTLEELPNKGDLLTALRTGGLSQ